TAGGSGGAAPRGRLRSRLQFLYGDVREPEWRSAPVVLLRAIWEYRYPRRFQRHVLAGNLRPHHRDDRGFTGRQISNRLAHGLPLAAAQEVIPVRGGVVE